MEGGLVQTFTRSAEKPVPGKALYVSIGGQAYTLISIHAARLKALEKKGSKQTEIIKDRARAVEPEPETPYKATEATTSMQGPCDESAKPIQETQTEIPGPKPEKNMELPDYLIPSMLIVFSFFPVIFTRPMYQRCEAGLNEQIVRIFNN